MTNVDVVVIGAGPAGCTAAAVAARAGLRVVLFEAGEHPRAHVGESLLPGIIPILADIDALAAVEQGGFGRKTGSTLWHWGRTPRWDLWFADSDEYDHAWLVDRSRFDAILFDAARRAGAVVHERCVVHEPIWADGRVVGVRWRPRDDQGPLRETTARLVVDATGQSAMLGRALALRESIPGLRHQAMWAHFRGVGRLPPPRAEQALFVATPQQWWWLFPLSPELTSIGVVQLDAAERRGPPRPDFDGELRACTELASLVADAERIGPVRHERDWSWRMRDVAGPGWIAVGDAAGFIDPVLSTGVMLALHSGWHAGKTAIDVVREGSDEAAALHRYRTHHLGTFEDLVRMVRFYYQQNLHREDYFWESKRILLQEHTALRPQKAFVVLTSGLVQNLALDDVRASAAERRRERAGDAAHDLDGADPDVLGFVCLHLRKPPADDDADEGPDRGTSLFVLIEPRDPVLPTLVRTRNFHVNGIAPRHGNDPIAVPELAPALRAVADLVTALDTDDGESLASFWRRVRTQIGTRLRAAPDGFRLVRVFGE